MRGHNGVKFDSNKLLKIEWRKWCWFSSSFYCFLCLYYKNCTCNSMLHLCGLYGSSIRLSISVSKWLLNMRLKYTPTDHALSRLESKSTGNTFSNTWLVFKIVLSKYWATDNWLPKFSSFCLVMIFIPHSKIKVGSESLFNFLLKNVPNCSWSSRFYCWAYLNCTCFCCSDISFTT